MNFVGSSNLFSMHFLNIFSRNRNSRFSYSINTLVFRFLLSFAWLFALTSFSVASAATTFTYTKGAATTFTNGHYISGTMDIDFTAAPPTVTATDIKIYDSSDSLLVSFSNSDAGSVGQFSNTICGVVKAFKEVMFSKSSYTLFLDFEQSNTTMPIPGTTGVRTSMFLPNSTSVNLSSTCDIYNTPSTPNPIPTLGEWAMIFMASLVAMFGIRRMRSSK
jgi:hypothetical protein